MMKFTTDSGLHIPSVDEIQMREVDRIAVEDFGLGILQMMENAGRNLALMVIEVLGGMPGKEITIAAGPGGNGGGGICAARHLHNRGYKVHILLTKNPHEYRKAAGDQLKILIQAGLLPQLPENGKDLILQADIVIDALIGYSLFGAPRGSTADTIKLINRYAKRVIALDLPSGVDATTGETPGVFIKADRTLTLALPKKGLKNPAAGKIFLADIGIPPEVYYPLGIKFGPFFRNTAYFPVMVQN